MVDRDWFKIKAEGLFRLLMVNCLSGILPLYIVTEYPKSGGSWVSQMLSDYFNVPFPRNQFPKLQPSIMHGHYLYSPFMKNVFVLIRDGRDVMVSYYFHSLFVHTERFNTRLVEITRKELPFHNYNDVKKNLPKFIEYKFTKKKYPRFTWCDFLNSWEGKDVGILKYENLLQDPVKELIKVLYKVTKTEPNKNRLKKIIEKYSFKNLTKRNPGEENKYSFLRKGIAGDWKNYFTRDAARLFNEFAGNELIKFGYENDNSWIKRIS